MGDRMYYLKRTDYGIRVTKEHEDVYVKNGLKGYINDLCLNNFSTYDGRKKAASRLLNEKSNIPIYIDNSTFLYPTKALREYDMLFLNYYAILSFRKIDSANTLFIFKNLEELVVQISINKVIRQHKRIEIINDYIDNLFWVKNESVYIKDNIGFNT